MNAPANISAAVRSACPYCGVGCGVLARPNAEGGAIVTGDPDHPANFGRLCSKGFALGETLGLESRLLYPMLRQADGVARARRLGHRARRGGRWLQAHRRATRAGQHRVLSVGAIADRGLLRRQQADEGLPRLGERRHQLAALHGVVGGGPSPRVRRGHRAGQLRRPRSRRPHRAGRLQCRLVPSDPVPAHDPQPARPWRQARGDRSAPHRDGGRRRSVPADCAGHRHGAVQRLAGASRRHRAAR